MSQVNLDDLFNATPTIEQEQQVITEFKPAAKKGQGQVYEAIIRFIPNPEDPSNKSIVAKNTVFLKNPLTNAQMEVDAPSTIGQPDPLQDTFFALRNSDNPILKENSKNFSRRQRYASLVQIITCKPEPSLEGKILVWRYGMKIHEKIYNEMNPTFGTPRNPFNMFQGRPFYVKVKMVSGFNNFDDSQFIDMPNPADSALRIQIKNKKGEEGWQPITQQVVADNPSVKEIIFNYLKEHCPSLTPYEYQPWSDEIRNFVDTCIKIYSNPQMSMQAATGQIAQHQSNPYMSQPAQSPVAAPVSTIPQTQGLQMDLSGLNTQQPNTFAASSISGLDNNIDDLLNMNSAPKQTPAAPTEGLKLDDVLSGLV